MHQECRSRVFLAVFHVPLLVDTLLAIEMLHDGTHFGQHCVGNHHESLPHLVSAQSDGVAADIDVHCIKGGSKYLLDMTPSSLCDISLETLAPRGWRNDLAQACADSKRLKTFDIAAEIGKFGLAGTELELST